MSSLSLSVFIVFISLWSLKCHAQVPFPSHCPQVKVMDPFDLDAYMGIWYEHSKYPFVFEFGKRCMYATYGNNGNGTVSVVNAAINIITQKPSNVTGTATVMGPGELAVSFSPRPATKANYLILGTDYTTYSVVYSCSNFTALAHTKIIWILTRERKPPTDVVDSAKKVIEDNQLSQTFMMDTNQENCPQIDANGAVVQTDKEDVTTEPTMHTL